MGRAPLRSDPPPPPARQRRWAWAFVALWLAGVGAGMLALGRYKSTPGAMAEARARWPEESRLRREAGRATLVMLVHPYCPCSRASLAELAVIQERAGDRLTAHVVFMGDGETFGGADGALWREAGGMAGVIASWDEGGHEARLFGGATSGHTALYDPEGRLVFRGGITGSRGHTGDNAGLRSVLSLLASAVETRGEAARAASTPVFGCALEDPEGRP